MALMICSSVYRFLMMVRFPLLWITWKSHRVHGIYTSVKGHAGNPTVRVYSVSGGVTNLAQRLPVQTAPEAVRRFTCTQPTFLEYPDSKGFVYSMRDSNDDSALGNA
jgi:hypothetical protein|tara:strand:+ start:7903 stop:8223 length:321 start_codon:yes stop_codon:yes gene_type:complete